MRHEVALFLHKVPGAIRIPAGTIPRKCKGSRCEDQIYAFVQLVKEKETWRAASVAPYYPVGKTEPIEGVPPTATEDGAGVDHHANCIDVEHFKRKR